MGIPNYGSVAQEVPDFTETTCRQVREPSGDDQSLRWGGVFTKIVRCCDAAVAPTDDSQSLIIACKPNSAMNRIGVGAPRKAAVQI